MTALLGGARPTPAAVPAASPPAVGIVIALPGGHATRRPGTPLRAERPAHAAAAAQRWSS